MISHVRHLREQRLFDCYLAERHREPLDPPTADHLADCDACRARYAELARLMDALRTEADAETDAVFTAERLQAQQLQIARRLEQVGRHARIISFPGRTATGPHPSAAPRAAMRWIAAAAAAGLFIGVGVGVGLFSDSAPQQAVRFAAARPGRPPVASGGTVAFTNTADEEAFLSEIELAADRPQTPELAPFDALTPHVREVATQIR